MSLGKSLASFLGQFFPGLLKSLTQAGFEATHSEELAAAKARIAELEGQVADLNAAKAAAMKAYNDLEARATAAQNDLQSLQVAYRSLQAGYATLEAKVKGVEDETAAKVDAATKLSDTDALRSDL